MIASKMHGTSLRITALSLACSISTSAFAGSAADALLNATAPTSPAAGTESAQPTYITPSVMALDEIKLSSPIARQVFSEWMAAPSNQFEMNAWVKGFLKNQFEPTAHLWSAMQSKISEKFAHAAQAAHLYSLHRIGVPQTFFNQWMQSLANPDFAASKAAGALEESISANFDAWLSQNAIQISSDQETLIQKLGATRSSLFSSLAASTYLRKGEAGAELLPKLPVNSEYRPLLAQTAAIALAKRGDLANAARVLKTYYEPWLVKTGDAQKLAVYYLQIARLLYQAGSLEGAISYYEKVPTGMPQYLTAREELSWCWLRTGNIAQLRGTLETLTSRTLDNHFQPEAYLVRAITNLKMCYYAEVEKDFAAFLTVNRRWAKQIGENLARAEPAAPRTLDLFSVRAQKMIGARESEMATLKNLADRSISAVLPAVGPQKHWTMAQDQVRRDLDSAKKLLAAEFRRQWKNDRQTLAEAIRKMQFVKVELLSQVTAAKESDQIVVTKSSTAQTEAPAAAMGSREDLVFPFDGVIWPDELFKLRSRSQGRCLGQN